MKMPAPKQNRGRPTGFTKKIGSKVCERIAKGESLRSIVKDKDMPSASMVCRWLLQEDKKDFREQYEEARNIQADLMFEELIEIADTTEEGVETVLRDGKEEIRIGDMLGHRRLKVDTRKWFLSKVLPKKYGDKMDLDVMSGGKVIQAFNFVKPNGKDNTDN